MNNKCKLCKCKDEANCPCHFNPDDELCDFSFELIDIDKYDNKIRADERNKTINGCLKALQITCNKRPSIVTLDSDIEYMKEILEQMKGGAENE